MKRWTNIVFLVIVSLILWGCDDTDKNTIQQIDNNYNETKIIVEPDDEPAITENEMKETPLPPSVAIADEHKELISDQILPKSYQNKTLSILDSSEIMLNGASTLVVTFSIPLESKQNFNELVSLVQEGKGKVDGNWELSNSGLELRHRYLAPNTQLTLNIDKSIVAINGKSLKSAYQTTLMTRNRSPMVGFTSNGSLLPSNSMKGLPITTLNVEQVDINFFRVQDDKLYEFMQNYGLSKQLSVWSSEEILAYSDLAYSARFNLSPKLNVQENKIVDLSNIKELKAEGIYFAVLNQAGKYRYFNSMTIFSISNIGISVHDYQNGKLSIFAHQLDDGSALANIKLVALCEKKNEKCNMITAQTDQQGYAELTFNPAVQYQILTASNGEQMSFVYLTKNAVDLSEFNVLGRQSYQKQLFTFAARDLYRPGETVTLNALLRDADGQLFVEQPIKTEIINPAGQLVKNFVWQVASPNSGFYQTDFLIPLNAAVGKWTVKFNLGDDVYRYYSFSVEEFSPERIAVALVPMSDKAILNNQNANFTIKSWYLYGAPSAGNEQQSRIVMSKERSITQLPDFYIGSITESNLDRTVDTVEDVLDSQGMAKISINKQNWQTIKSPIKVMLQTSVLDAGGHPVTRTVTQSIWPANRMPAVRALFAESRYYDWSLGQYVVTPTIDAGSSADFEIAYIDNEGNKYSSEKLVARLVKERRDYFWTWSDNEGWQAQYDQKEFVLSEQSVKVMAGGTTKIRFLPDDLGSYRIEVVDLNSDVVSSMRFWSGYRWSDNTKQSEAVRPDQVKLTLDKLAYKIGDTAKVRVEAPVSGSGYISLETNSGTLWMKKISVSQEGIEVDIPIKDWGRHDIYINAMIIRPSTDSTIRTVKRAIGLLYLPIDTSERQLKLTLDVANKTHPEKTVKVKVKVNDQQLKNSKIMVLLSAVDNDVLNITNYTTPDPYSFFLGRKRYDVEQFDVYGKLIEGDGNLIGMSFGGDNDATLNQPQLAGRQEQFKDANIVAQQLKVLTLNSNCEGEIELAIPNFNGELRLMAQVWDNNRFGYAQQMITVAAPIVAELSMPRFLSGGDQTVMALELHNLTDLTQNITLNVSTDGLMTLLNKDTPQQITLNPYEQKFITVPVVANYGLGQGRVIISVDNIKLIDGQHYQLSRSWSVGIRPGYAQTSRVSSAILNGGEGWTLSPSALKDFIDNTIEAEVVLSHNPTFNITKYIKSLNNYEYGSLEQTISRLYPSLYANQEQLQNLGIESTSDDERHKYVLAEIDRIMGMQRVNGSFGLWNKESPEEYWLTVYTVDFLLRAQERGYPINQQGLNKALARLEQYLYEPSAFYNLVSSYDIDIEDYIEFSTKSYAALILAKQKKITPAMRNELKRLYQQVKSNGNAVLLSPLPIMQLSIASKLTGNTRTYQDLFEIALLTPRDSQYYWLGDYGSAIRDKVQIYNLMVEYQLAEELQADYLINLSDTLKNERYLSTQELSTLFFMSWENMQKQDKEKLIVLLNNKERLKSTEAIYRTMDYKQLTDGISVHNPHNAPPLYVQFSLSGYANKMPKPTPIDGILGITRRYFDSKGNSIIPEQLKVGDVVIIMLDVSADREINDALVVDMLPAGLEIENPNISNSLLDLHSNPELSTLLKGEAEEYINYREYRDDRYVAAIDIYNSTAENRYSTKLIYLARAVGIGQFVVPAPYVQSMYKTQWYAIGESINIMTITAK